MATNRRLIWDGFKYKLETCFFLFDRKVFGGKLCSLFVKYYLHLSVDAMGVWKLLLYTLQNVSWLEKVGLKLNTVCSNGAQRGLLVLFI